MDPSNAFVMVPCTTNLRGTYKVHVQDPHEDPGADFYPECRVHAIGHRDVDVSIAGINVPDRAGTWYLLTLRELSWFPNPVWVHEDDSNLHLGF
jgi:hypothetical protein